MLKISVIRKLFYIFFPLVLIAVLGWAMRYESQLFIIEDVPVSIKYEKSHHALVASVQRAFDEKLVGLKGGNIWAVDLGQLKKEIQVNPWVKSLKLNRYFPDKIVAVVEISQAALLFFDGKNNLTPVLQSGAILPTLSATTAPLVPILYNEKVFNNSVQLKKMIKLLTDLPNSGELQKVNRGSVDFDEIAGLTIQLLAEDIQIHFGHNDIETKALQVLRVIDYLKSQKIKARVIDASFSKKVLVRPRKRP